MTERDAPKQTPQRISFDDWVMRTPSDQIPEENLLIQTDNAVSTEQKAVFAILAENNDLTLKKARRSAFNLLIHVNNNMDQGDTLYQKSRNGDEAYDFFTPIMTHDEILPPPVSLTSEELGVLIQHADRYHTTVMTAFSNAIDIFNAIHTNGVFIAKTDGTTISIPYKKNNDTEK